MHPSAATDTRVGCGSPIPAGGRVTPSRAARPFDCSLGRPFGRWPHLGALTQQGPTPGGRPAPPLPSQLKPLAPSETTLPSAPPPPPSPRAARPIAAYTPNFPGYLAYVSIAWFCLSLCFNGVDAVGHAEAVRGLKLLLNGWMGFGEGIFPWLASPLLAVSWWLMLGRQRFMAAAILAALALLVLSHWAAGGLAPATLAQGFLLWVASATLQLLAATLASLRALSKSARPISPPGR
jgi:hypothetical protein